MWFILVFEALKHILSCPPLELRVSPVRCLFKAPPPHDNFPVATDTMTVTDTDILHASALCSWKLHYFSICTDTETDRLLCVCQIQTGYRVSARYGQATACLPDTDRLHASALCSRIFQLFLMFFSRDKSPNFTYTENSTINAEFWMDDVWGNKKQRILKPGGGVLL